MIAPVRISAQIDLPVPREDAWNYVVGWEGQIEWMRDAASVRVLTSHRQGFGVILAVRTRVFGVPLLTDHLEVTVWEPPRRLVISHRGLVRGVGEWLLEPAGPRTRFTWTEELRLSVPVLGRPVLLAYRPLMRGQMRASLSSLQRVLRQRA